MGLGCHTRLLLLKPAIELVQFFSQLLIGLSAGGWVLMAFRPFHTDVGSLLESFFFSFPE